jgi:hypothetical protein
MTHKEKKLRQAVNKTQSLWNHIFNMNPFPKRDEALSKIHDVHQLISEAVDGKSR